MTKMRCLRDHSSTVWGNQSAGDLFDVDDGYVTQLEESGLAERVSRPAPPQPEGEGEPQPEGEGEPQPEGEGEPQPEGEGEPSVEDAIASLQAPVTSDNTPTRRGRRRNR